MATLKEVPLAVSSGGFSPLPDINKDIRAWNRAWERRLENTYGGSPKSPIKTADPSKYMFYLTERNVANTISKKRHLCEAIHRLSEMVMIKDQMGESYEDHWRKQSVSEREIVVLEGLRSVSQVATDESGVRFEVPEVTLAKMVEGNAWWSLVEHFLVPPIDVPEDYKILHHPLWDKLHLLDRQDEGVPLHRAIRAFQYEVLLDRHTFLILFLLGCISHIEGLEFGTYRVQNQSGSRMTKMEKDLLHQNLDVTPTEFKRILETTKRENKLAEKVCNTCQKPARLCPELIASGKGFSFCGACTKVGRKVPYCSRACQVQDFKAHKKTCGKKLSETHDLPTFSGPSSTPKFRMTTGIQRHLGEIALHPACWHAFYGSGQKRVITFAAAKTKEDWMKVRELAINDRDPESLGIIYCLLRGMVDGTKVTLAGVTRQMLSDFALTQEQLDKAVEVAKSGNKLGLFRVGHYLGQF